MSTPVPESSPELPLAIPAPLDRSPASWAALVLITSLTVLLVYAALRTPTEITDAVAKRLFEPASLFNAIQETAILLVLVLLVQFATDGSLRPLGLPSENTRRAIGRGMAYGAALFLGLQLLLPSALLWLFPQLAEEHPNVLENAVPDLATFTRALVIVFFSASIREELWRVTFIRAWERPFGPSGATAGYLLSSGAFALLHAYQGPIAIALTGLLGLLLGSRWLRQRDLTELIAAHFSFDTCVLILLYASQFAPST